MKLFTFLTLLLITNLGFSQELPIDFESSMANINFVDFDGGVATIISNPQPNGINSSATVAKIVRNGGTIWSGSKINLAANLNFSTLNSISMKVFTTAPIGTVVKFKLEGNGTTDRDVLTTVSNEWEVLTWDFTSTPTNFNSIVFMFDFGNVGNGTSTSTFLFDDIQQIFTGFQVDLPVSFEEENINYALIDFGGTTSSIIADPLNSGNNIVKVIKTNQAATWAGTTIGTQAGFASNIPLSLTQSKMSVKVWSPASGTPVRLKVEDSNDPTHTCETQTNTTIAEGWETLQFNFVNQAQGTESLSVGLAMGWTYNKASIFFNFGTTGAAAGEKTYYFDDVVFGNNVVGNNEVDFSDINIFPNPTQNEWTIRSENDWIKQVEIFDVLGKKVYDIQPNQSQITISSLRLNQGSYMAKITLINGIKCSKLVKY